MQKNTLSSAHIAPYVFILLGVALWIYIGLRAHLLSMTHDESGTFNYLIDKSLWQLFTADECWTSANNHILNTFLMQVFVKIGGAKELFIRMPNVLAFGMFLWFVWKWLASYTQNVFFQFVGAMLIILNPYMLDFFSLGRGYGLSLGFEMGAWYYLWKYLETRQIKNATWMMGMLIAGVLSNFTALNYFAALIFFFNVILLFDAWKSQTPFAFLLKNNLAVIMGTLILVGLIVYPLTLLKAHKEFEWGATSVFDTLTTLITNSLYGLQGRYFPEFMHPFVPKLFFYIFVSCYFVGMIAAGNIVLRKPLKDWSLQEKGWILTLVLPLFILIETIVQYYALGTFYLINRTATQLLPLFGLAFFTTFVYLWSNYKIMKPIVLIPVLFLGFHFVRSVNVKECVEWYYDQNTKEMVQYLMTKTLPDRKLKVGMHWYFAPSSRFYYKQYHLENTFEEFPYSHEWKNEDAYDYYYVNAEDTDKLPKHYQPEVKFHGGRTLMKKQ